MTLSTAHIERITKEWPKLDAQVVNKVAAWLKSGDTPPTWKSVHNDLSKITRLAGSLRDCLEVDRPGMRALASQQIQSRRDGALDRIRSGLSELVELANGATQRLPKQSTKSRHQDPPTAIGDLKEIVERAGYTADDKKKGALYDLVRMIFEDCGIDKDPREAIRAALEVGK